MSSKKQQAAKESEKAQEQFDYDKNKLEKDVKKKANEVERDVKQKANKVEQKVKETSEDVKDYAKEKTENVKDKAKEVKNKAQNTSYSADRQTTHHFSDAGPDQNRNIYYGKETVHPVGEYDKDKWEKVGDYEREKYNVNNAPENEGGILQSAKDTISSAYNVVATKVAETAEIAKEKVENFFHSDTTTTTDVKDPLNTNLNRAPEQYDPSVTRPPHASGQSDVGSVNKI